MNSFPIYSKSSVEFDGLSLKLLKHFYPIISKSLFLLVNKLFTSGCFPDLLKIASVVLIFKGGSPDYLINYGPISILLSLSKIFERLMYAKLLSFINKFKLFSDCQFRFQKHLSTKLYIIRALYSDERE